MMIQEQQTLNFISLLPEEAKLTGQHKCLDFWVKDLVSFLSEFRKIQEKGAMHFLRSLYLFISISNTRLHPDFLFLGSPELKLVLASVKD